MKELQLVNVQLLVGKQIFIYVFSVAYLHSY